MQRKKLKFLDLLLTAAYSRAGSMGTRTHFQIFHLGCLLSGPQSTGTDSTTSASMSNILIEYKQECKSKRFQDTNSNVDTNSYIEEDHRTTDIKLRIIATLVNWKWEFLDLLLTATYCRSGSMGTKTH